MGQYGGRIFNLVFHAFRAHLDRIQASILPEKEQSLRTGCATRSTKTSRKKERQKKAKNLETKRTKNDLVLPPVRHFLLLKLYRNKHVRGRPGSCYPDHRRHSESAYGTKLYTIPQSVPRSSPELIIWAYYLSSLIVNVFSKNAKRKLSKTVHKNHEILLITSAFDKFAIKIVNLFQKTVINKNPFSY